MSCIPRPPAAAKPNKRKPSTCLPVCLRPPLPPRRKQIGRQVKGEDHTKPCKQTFVPYASQGLTCQAIFLGQRREEAVCPTLIDYPFAEPRRHFHSWLAGAELFTVLRCHFSSAPPPLHRDSKAQFMRPFDWGREGEGGRLPHFVSSRIGYLRDATGRLLFLFCFKQNRICGRRGRKAFFNLQPVHCIKRRGFRFPHFCHSLPPPFFLTFRKLISLQKEPGQRKILNFFF